MTAPMPVYSESFIHAQPWVKDGACLEVDPDLFFPKSGDHASAATARVVCAGCPVAGECLEFALSTDQKFGIWGGLTPRQRKQYATHTCRSCGLTIRHLSKQHRYCESCAVVRRAETKRAYEQKGAA